MNKKSGMVVGEAFNRNGLYIVKTEGIGNKLGPAETHILANDKISKYHMWHQWVSHVSMTNVKELYKKNLVRGLENISNDNVHCNGCSVGKSTKAPCKQIKYRQTKAILELVHSDLCGPITSKSIGGSKYFLTITDNYSQKTVVYCLKAKGEVVNYIRKYIARVERKTNRKVKRIRTDNGLEFCNNELKALFNDLGIKHERTNTYTPQMNGVSERIEKERLRKYQCGEDCYSNRPAITSQAVDSSQPAATDQAAVSSLGWTAWRRDFEKIESSKDVRRCFICGVKMSDRMTIKQ